MQSEGKVSKVNVWWVYETTEKNIGDPRMNENHDCLLNICLKTGLFQMQALSLFVGTNGKE